MLEMLFYNKKQLKKGIKKNFFFTPTNQKLNSLKIKNLLFLSYIVMKKKERKRKFIFNHHHPKYMYNSIKYCQLTEASCKK